VLVHGEAEQRIQDLSYVENCGQLFSAEILVDVAVEARFASTAEIGLASDAGMEESGTNVLGWVWRYGRRDPRGWGRRRNPWKRGFWNRGTGGGSVLARGGIQITEAETLLCSHILP
jgi:hypothetical protein